jgi:Nucleotidyl transferase AbiEii toxin, Type IV TA system
MSGFPKGKRPHNMRVLGNWVRQFADQERMAESRVRRAVSFMLVALPLERSLDSDGNPLFLVKGGVSMELRLGLRARTTKDLDAVFRGAFEDWLDALDDALAEDVEGFSFGRGEPARIGRTDSCRVEITIDYRGRRWGKVRFEVAPVEVDSILDVDQVEPFDIGQFGLTAPGQIAVVGLPYLVAQKLHACTEVFDDDENDRVHDLMDLMLARDLLEADDLIRAREACLAIFASRSKQAWPPSITTYPSWAETFARLAAEEGFPVTDVELAADAVREFIAAIDAAVLVAQT